MSSAEQPWACEKRAKPAIGVLPAATPSRAWAAKLPIEATPLITHVARVEGRIVAFGTMGIACPAQAAEKTRPRDPVWISLLPWTRAGLCDQSAEGWAPWEHVLAEQLRWLQGRGESLLYFLARGPSARSAVLSLWQAGGSRQVHGEAQRQFGLGPDWYAVRMSVPCALACLNARLATHELLERAARSAAMSLGAASRSLGGQTAPGLDRARARTRGPGRLLS